MFGHAVVTAQIAPVRHCQTEIIDAASVVVEKQVGGFEGLEGLLVGGAALEFEIPGNAWHKAEKRTWLYIVGAQSIPEIPRREGRPTHVVRPKKNGTGAKIVTKSEREHTPPNLARWLVELAGRCTPPPAA